MSILNRIEINTGNDNIVISLNDNLDDVEKELRYKYKRTGANNINSYELGNGNYIDIFDCSIRIMLRDMKIFKDIELIFNDYITKFSSYYILCKDLYTTYNEVNRQIIVINEPIDNCNIQLEIYKLRNKNEIMPLVQINIYNNSNWNSRYPK